MIPLISDLKKGGEMCIRDRGGAPLGGLFVPFRPSEKEPVVRGGTDVYKRQVHNLLEGNS